MFTKNFTKNNIAIKILLAIAVVLNMGIITLGYMRASRAAARALEISEVIEITVSCAFQEVLSSFNQNDSILASPFPQSGSSQNHGPVFETTFPSPQDEGNGLEGARCNKLSWTGSSVDESM